MDTVNDSELMFPLVYNSTSDIMFLLKIEENRELIYMSVNNRFARFLGLRKEECIGKKFEELFPGYFSNQLIEGINLIISSGRNYKSELSIPIQNQTKYFNVTVHPLLKKNKDFDKIMVIAQDITEWKNREEELIKLKKQAEESNKLKSALLMNLNHEIRTPLHGILGLAEIMRDEIIQDEFKKMASDIKKAGNRLLNTLHSIIELSMLEAEEKNIDYTSIELNDVIQSIFDKYIYEAELKGLYFRIENLAPDLQLHVDRLILIEILSHVIDNAIKFTKVGGVKIVIERKSDNAGNYAYIKVIDTGIGISESNLEKIFHEFIQESEGIGRSHEGMGLGLALVKRMMNLMNGQIFVESEKNFGSIFTLKFPAVSSQETESEELSPANSGEIIISLESQLPTILMVEDNELNSNLTKVFLKNTCIVDHVTNALSALQMVKDKTYDAILMDINLGSGMNGVDAVNEIRKMENYKHVPITAMTGYALNNDKNYFLARGFTHYLAKPFQKAQLLELMNEIFTAISI